MTMNTGGKIVAYQRRQAGCVRAIVQTNAITSPAIGHGKRGFREGGGGAGGGAAAGGAFVGRSYLR